MKSLAGLGIVLALVLVGGPNDQTDSSTSMAVLVGQRAFPSVSSTSPLDSTRDHRSLGYTPRGGTDLGREPVASSAVQSPVLPEPEPSQGQVPPEAPVAVVPQTPLEQLVCQYSWDCATALTIMWAESGGRADAYNPASGVCGLFQLAPVHQGVLDLFGGNCYDAQTNVAAAHWLYEATLSKGYRNGWCKHWFAQVGYC